jgi:hypothetical protein
MTTAAFFISEKAQVPTLVLKGEWNGSIAPYMRTHQIVGLRLSGYLGWHSTHLDFLHDVPFVEYLDILATKVEDISGIYALKELSYLSLEGRTPSIDFSRLPRLKTLALGKVSPGLHLDLWKAKTIRKLALTAPKPASLAILEQLPVLQELGVCFASIYDLSFAAGTAGLRRLSLVACNSLRTLQGIECSKGLLVLSIEQAKALSDIRALVHSFSLRTLVLRDCPNIKTIEPIRGLPNLETVGLMQTTNVKDGNLSPLLSLPKLQNATFIDRLHYSHRCERFPKKVPAFY